MEAEVAGAYILEIITGVLIKEGKCCLPFMK